MLMESSALQFAKDVSINNKWFKSWDYSEYGGHNSLNIMNLKMENGSIDWLILNHILEHVSNDVIAIKELARVLTASGVIQITVPSPLYSLDTYDWGFADPSINYHYREYGADLSLKLGAICRDLSLNAIVALPFDAVSSTFEAVYFLTKQHARCKDIYMILKSGNIPSIRIN
jgi:SAM-dependent methyltransferase